VFEFTNKNESLGTIAHAQKFNEYIKMTSNKNLLNQSEDTMQSQLFMEEEIESALRQGSFECIGSELLYKQPGIDGYHNNMGDLRDFIEQRMSKLESTINNSIIASTLKHFKPATYGLLLEIDDDLSKRIEDTQKSIETLSKLYKYIMHRRILEGKEKQANLGTQRLNMSDIADINMIDRRCVQIESNVRFLKYMKWFVSSNFFVIYQDKFEYLQQKNKNRQSEKRNHYKSNLLQMIKDLVLVDNTFIEKVFEESNIRGDTPKASYGFLLKNSKFSNLKYSGNGKNEEQQNEQFSYPLKNIEEFIVLLKATNVSKIKDYIILYTLLDLGYDQEFDNFKSLLIDLDLEESYREIRFYWRLENAFVDKASFKKIPDELRALSNTNSHWATSVLQTLLELKHYDLAMVFACSKDIDRKQQKSIELTVYALCE